MSSRYTMDLTEGSVVKKMIRFVFPIFMASVLQQFYNTADIIVVGRWAGDTALAAVGSTSALVNLMLNLFLGLAVGANVLCARFFGAKDYEGLSRAIHTSILLGLISGLFLSVAGIFLARPLLQLMGTPADVIDSSVLYIRIYFLGAPFSLLYNFGAGILRASGDTKRPLYILSLSGIVNVVLNLFCVIVLRWGVAGVAIGTVASQIVAAFLVFFILVRSDSVVFLNVKKLRLHKKELLQIIMIGIPAGFNGIMFNVGNVILQSTVNSFGKIVMAGTTAANSVEIYIFIVIASMEQCVVSVVGQCVGARKYRRIDQVWLVGFLLAMGGTVMLCVIVATNMEFFLRFFTEETAVVEAGIYRLSVVCFWYWSYMASPISSGALRGMGHSTLPTVINAISICLTRVVWIFAFFPHNRTLTMLFWCYPISWVVSSTAQFVAYRIMIRKLQRTQPA